MIGTVKWFDANRGYGFITVKGHLDVFVHISELRDAEVLYLLPGEEWELEIHDGEKGFEAICLRKPNLTDRYAEESVADPCAELTSRVA